MPQAPKYPVLTLIKSIEIINYLSMLIDNRGATITELGSYLSLGKSSIHRLLDTLLYYGYVEKNELTKCYRLGWKLYTIGQMVPQQNQLASLDKQFMIEIAERTAEIVNLGVLRDNETVIISQVDGSTSSLRVNMQQGTREPVYATALGKILFLEQSDEDILKILETAKPFVSYTSRTISSEEGFLKAVQQARKRGFATDLEEYSPGLVCIACPVRDYTRRIIAAMSVSLPKARYNRTSHAKVLAALQEGTKKASYALGYRP